MLIVGGFELWTSITSHFLREIAMKFASNSSTIKIPTLMSKILNSMQNEQTLRERACFTMC